MPKRSNEFQRLVYLVRLNLADGAKVTESKLMRDRLTKTFREVDVIIEGEVGQQPVTVAIECRDHKRVADVTWVEMMKAKHERLDTNVLILASRKGFTSEARNVAESYGIELIALEDLDAADFSDKLGPNSSLWLKSISATVEKVTIRVASVNEFDAETVIAMPDNIIYLEDGAELCQAREIVDHLRECAREYQLREGSEEHAWFHFTWEPPRDSKGRPLYMKKMEPEAFRPIQYIRIAGPCKIEVGRFGMRHNKLGDTKLAWGKTTVSGRHAMIVATLAENGATKLSLDISDPPAK